MYKNGFMGFLGLCFVRVVLDPQDKGCGEMAQMGFGRRLDSLEILGQAMEVFGFGLFL
jgi:hypothetical protein